MSASEAAFSHGLVTKHRKTRLSQGPSKGHTHQCISVPFAIINQVNPKEPQQQNLSQTTVLDPTGRHDSTSTAGLPASRPPNPEPAPSLGCSLCRGVLANGGPGGWSASVSCIAFAAISAFSSSFSSCLLCRSLQFPLFSVLDLSSIYHGVCYCLGVASVQMSATWVGRLERTDDT